jgi:hypothetical protein
MHFIALTDKHTGSYILIRIFPSTSLVNFFNRDQKYPFASTCSRIGTVSKRDSGALFPRVRIKEQFDPNQ